MPTQPETLQELLVDNLRDLYDAEKQLTKALPKISKRAGSETLQKAINEHLEQTRRQAERLERVFGLLGESARSKPCAGMKGIIEEGEEHAQENAGSALLDAVLTGGGRKIEHYEIASYTSAVELATFLGNRQAARLLQQNLGEEERMDRKLAQLSARWLKEAGRAESQAA